MTFGLRLYVHERRLFGVAGAFLRQRKVRKRAAATNMTNFNLHEMFEKKLSLANKVGVPLDGAGDLHYMTPPSSHDLQRLVLYVACKKNESEHSVKLERYRKQGHESDGKAKCGS